LRCKTIAKSQGLVVLQNHHQFTTGLQQEFTIWNRLVIWTRCDLFFAS